MPYGKINVNAKSYILPNGYGNIFAKCRKFNCLRKNLAGCMDTKLLKRTRKLRKLTLEQLAEDVHISVSQLSRFESGQRRPRADEVRRIATRLEISAAELLGDPASEVPVIGRITAGAEVVLLAEDQVTEFVRGYDGAPESTVAIVIQGSCLGQMFAGWLAYYDEVKEGVQPDMIDRLCVVWLDDGRIFARQVVAGTIPGAYTLLSNFDPPIYDAVITKAAHVRNIQPRTAV